MFVELGLRSRLLFLLRWRRHQVFALQSTARTNHDLNEKKEKEHCLFPLRMFLAVRDLISIISLFRYMSLRFSPSPKVQTKGTYYGGPASEDESTKPSASSCCARRDRSFRNSGSTISGSHGASLTPPFLHALPLPFPRPFPLPL